MPGALAVVRCIPFSDSFFYKLLKMESPITRELIFVNIYNTQFLTQLFTALHAVNITAKHSQTTTKKQSNTVVTL